MPTVTANGVDIFHERFGDSRDPTLLLVCGLGAQCTRYEDEFVAAFVDRGLQVVRFDNRDAGLSTHLPPGSSYTLSDMAADAVGLLDALGVERAHIWGASMGGMIAQTMAIEHPQRLSSLTSVMSTTGEPDVGRADPAVLSDVLRTTEPAADTDEAVARAVAMNLRVGSPGLVDPEEAAVRHRGFVERSYDPEGVMRQAMAVMASGSRAEGLRGVGVPTLVIHGTADPLVDISGGRRTAALVPGAALVEIEGMGHDLPAPFWPAMVEATVGVIAGS